MSQQDAQHERYEEARRSFDGLDVEERARFLVEATASTLAHGLQRAGEALAEGLEETIREARSRPARSSPTGGPGAAEPETAQRQAPKTRSSEEKPDA